MASLQRLHEHWILVPMTVFCSYFAEKLGIGLSNAKLATFFCGIVAGVAGLHILAGRRMQVSEYSITSVVESAFCMVYSRSLAEWLARNASFEVEVRGLAVSISHIFLVEMDWTAASFFSWRRRRRFCL